MLLAEVAATSDAVAATRSRLAKRAAIADLLRRVADDAEAGSAEVEIAVAYLAGELRQRRTGLGWRSLRDLPAPAEEPGLTLTDVDTAFARMADLSGPGSATARQAEAAALFGAATAREQSLLAGLVSGELRQGALDSVVVDAVAEAAGVPADTVRRAVMLAGATGPVARAALTAGGPEAATEALATFRLTVGRAVRPMLAQSAPDVGAALDKLGAAPGDRRAPPSPWTSSSTASASRCTATATSARLHALARRHHRARPRDRRGRAGAPRPGARPRREALVVGPTASPPVPGDRRPLRDPGRAHRRRGGRARGLARALPFFFDVLHADGRDLLDEPLRDRLAVLDDLLADAAGPLAVRRLVTDDAAAATAFFDAAVAEGQEGVVVKSLAAPYAAGRRGAGWVKVKPRHTLDLVVLAVEQGSGRRSGWLSNIWLGARDPEGGFVMLGKTFKGMTDEMLAWQTQRFRELRTADEGTSCTCAPSRSSRSRSTASSARPATPAGSRCASRASSGTATTRRPPRPTRSTPSGARATARGGTTDGPDAEG